MESPVVKIAEWLRSLSIEAQADIAFIMSQLLPSVDLVEYTHDKSQLIEKFIDVVESHTGKKLGDVGFVLSFVAVFDYSFYNKRSTDDDWAETESFFKSIIEGNDETVSDSMRKSLQTSLDNLPKQKALWIAICEQWLELKKQYLNDNAIRSWEHSNMDLRAGSVQPVNVTVSG